MQIQSVANFVNVLIVCPYFHSCLYAQRCWCMLFSFSLFGMVGHCTTVLLNESRIILYKNPQPRKQSPYESIVTRTMSL